MQTDGIESVDDEQARKRRRLIYYVSAAVVVIILAVIVWMRMHAQATGAAAGGRRFQRTGPMPVGVATAAKQSFDIFVNGLGTVTPLEVVTVRSRVDGELVKVAFKEGDLVKEGDLLAQIDPRPYQVMLMQAQGQLARDKALLKNAEVDLERYRTLLEQDSTSKQQVDTQAALVDQYRAAIESDQATVANAQLQLTYSKVTAPISGRLGLRQVDRGNIVHASDANGLVVITKINPISVLFTVPEDRLAMLIRQRNAGVSSPVEAWDRSGKNLLTKGTLTTFDNQVDPTTGTVKLRATFDNTNGMLFPNQFVNVKLLVNKLEDATVIPVAAIQQGQQGTFVYVVKPDNTVSVRTIRAGSTQGDMIAVSKGVEPGDVVVTDGADKLRDGGQVEPVSAEQRAQATTPAEKKPRGDWQKNGGTPGDPTRKHKRDAATATPPSTP
jgi:membrane fusion protein, multidrug efflux system